MEGWIEAMSQARDTYLYVYIGMMRYLAPALAFVLLLRCAKPMLTFRREPEIWAWLCLEGGRKLPITHWENVIGRSKRSDVVIDFPTVSRNHAVLTRYDDGSWTLRLALFLLLHACVRVLEVCLICHWNHWIHPVLLRLFNLHHTKVPESCSSFLSYVIFLAKCK